jgi:hypothetical protein
VITTALGISGYKTTLTYPPSNKRIEEFPEASLGYIINYGRGHWVALHKDISGYTYKNSIGKDEPPTTDEITKFSSLKNEIEKTKKLGEEAAIAAAIAASLSNSVTINPSDGLRRRYADLSSYIREYNGVITAVISVDLRNQQAATNFLAHLDHSSHSTRDMINLFTGEIVPPEIIHVTSKIVQTPQNKHEIDFLTDLGLFKDGIVDPNTSVLYSPTGVFNAIIPIVEEPTHITKIINWFSGVAPIPPKIRNEEKTALTKYLVLMRDIVLPRRIAKLQAESSLSTTTHLGSQVQVEIAEMNTYVQYLTNYLRTK